MYMVWEADGGLSGDLAAVAGLSYLAAMYMVISKPKRRSQAWGVVQVMISLQIFGLLDPARRWQYRGAQCGKGRHTPASRKS